MRNVRDGAAITGTRRRGNGLPLVRTAAGIRPRVRPSAHGTLGTGGEHLRAAIDALPDPFAIHTAIRNDAGQIVDFSIEYVNAATTAFNGLSARRQIGGRLLELFPAMRHGPLFAAFVQVVETGEPFVGNHIVYEDEAAAGGPIRSLLDIRAVKLDDGYVVSSRDLTAYARAEAARRASEEQLERSTSLLAAIVEGTNDHVHVKDRDGRYVLVNGADAAWFGLPVEAIIGRTDGDLVDRDEAIRIARLDRAVIESGAPSSYEQDVVRAGVTRTWFTTKDIVRDPTGRAVGIFTISREITDQKRQEAQLRQVAKMEALGQLAGGVAHDFNNLLTAIRGYAELVRAELPADAALVLPDLDQVVLGADRAAALTRQLLAFSRLQVLAPTVIDPGAIAAGIAPLLRRLIGEHIELTVDRGPGVARVRADPAQLEQVIVNLAVNARDAMPGGGRLSIEVGTANLDAEYVHLHPEAAVGRHVFLAVADTGTGIDPATQAHIFEPFFTTKAPGKGTGLGLATVYGIVQQSGGSINVCSEPGRGTTFRIYLPQVEGPPAAPSDGKPRAVAVGGSETILLVEDDLAVRRLARRTLEALGYTVLEAADGAQALALASQHPGPIDALVTDVVMPGIQGTELAQQVVRIRPGIRVLFASGFSGNTAFAARALAPGSPYLPKPYSGDALGHSVRALFD